MPLLYTPEEAVERIGPKLLSVGELRKMIREGKVEHVRVGGKRKMALTEEHLQKLIEQCTQPATEQMRDRQVRLPVGTTQRSTARTRRVKS